jgi:RHS repeat-associated protein
LVKRVLDSETRVYVGSHYEYRAVGAGVTQYSYYYFGPKRVAMRRVVGEQNTLNYLHTDLLGSTGLATTSSGGMVQNSATYYYAYGASRQGGGGLPTDYRFTGQRLDGVSLYHMGARWYNAAVGLWLSADTVVPDPTNPQDLNRYSYVNNRPLTFADPTGHYGKDVHLDLTLQAAQRIEARVSGMAGLAVYPGEVGRLRASSVSNADQHTDENPTTWPVDVGTPVYGDGRSIAENYHFVGLQEAEGRLQTAIESSDASAFGTALHAYQDYWSHTRKGFSVPVGRRGIDRIHEVCPECSSLYTQEVLEDRAEELGHFLSKWNDQYTPQADVDDAYMLQGIEYWLTLFLWEMYGVDLVDYWLLYGEIDKPDEYVHEED